MKMRDEELAAHRLQHSQHISCRWCPFQVLWEGRAKELSAHVTRSHPVVCQHQKLWRENSAPPEAEVAGYSPSTSGMQTDGQTGCSWDRESQRDMASQLRHQQAQAKPSPARSEWEHLYCPIEILSEGDWAQSSSSSPPVEKKTITTGEWKERRSVTVALAQEVPVPVASSPHDPSTTPLEAEQGASTSESSPETQLCPRREDPLNPKSCPSAQSCARPAPSVEEHPDDHPQPVVPADPAASGSQPAVEGDDSAQGLGDYPWRLVPISVPHHSRYDGIPSDPRVLFHGAPVEHGSALDVRCFGRIATRRYARGNVRGSTMFPGEPRHWRGWNVWIFLVVLPTSQGRSTRWMMSTRISGCTPLRQVMKVCRHVPKVNLVPN